MSELFHKLEKVLKSGSSRTPAKINGAEAVLAELHAFMSEERKRHCELLFTLNALEVAELYSQKEPASISETETHIDVLLTASPYNHGYVSLEAYVVKGQSTIDVRKENPWLYRKIEAFIELFTNMVDNSKKFMAKISINVTEIMRLLQSREIDTRQIRENIRIEFV